MNQIFDITVKQLLREINEGSRFKLLDIRDPKDFQEYHIEGSANVNLDNIISESYVQSLLGPEPVYVICYMGKISKMVARFLQEKGIKGFNVRGGIAEWELQGFHIQKTLNSSRYDCPVKKKDCSVIHEFHSQVNHKTQLELIGAISAGIVHEINNPLAMLMGYLELFERRFELSVEEDLGQSKDKLGVKKFLEDMKRSISLINKTVEMTRRLTQNRDLEKTPTQISEVMSDIKDIMTFHSMKAEVIINIPDELKNIIFLGNQNGIVQVLTNLMKNSLDEISEQEQPWLHVNVKYIEKKSVIRVDVVDSGSGIPPYVQDRMFEQHFTTKKKKGSGLGLFLSRQLAEKLGGRLYLNTRYHNTCVSLEIPFEAVSSKSEDVA